MEEQKKYKYYNFVLSLIMLYVVFERTCKPAVVIYLISLLFAHWNFGTVFLILYLIKLTTVIIFFEANKERFSEFMVKIMQGKNPIEKDSNQ